MIQKWMIQILLAVEHLHKHKIVHRDLKYDNILFISDDLENLVISDFGESLDDLPTNLKTPYLTRGISKGGATAYLSPVIF